jgi:hypothetical protein
LIFSSASGKAGFFTAPIVPVCSSGALRGGAYHYPEPALAQAADELEKAAAMMAAEYAADPELTAFSYHF